MLGKDVLALPSMELQLADHLESESSIFWDLRFMYREFRVSLPYGLRGVRNTKRWLVNDIVCSYYSV